MTILFAGGEMGSFTPSSSSVSEDATEVYNSAFSRCALRITGASNTPTNNYAETSAFTQQTGDVYIHFHSDGGVNTGSHVWMRLYNGAGTEVFRVIAAYSSAQASLDFQYLDSLSAWQSAGTAVIAQPGLSDYDFHFNKTTGEIGWFQAGSRKAQYIGLSLSHIAGIAKVRFLSRYPRHSYSQVIIADVPTIGWRLTTIPVTGNGASTAWTYYGYQYIDEIAFDDADINYSDTANQEATYALQDPTLDGYTVLGIAVTARLKKGASGPANARLLLRSGGTNYDNGSDIAMDVGFAPYVAIWETDPATSNAWVNGAIASLQAGVKSIT